MVHGTTQRVPLIGNARNEDVSSVIDRRSEYYRKKARTRSLEEEEYAKWAQTIWTIPNIMTFARLIMVPVFFWLFTDETSGFATWSPFLAAVTFLLASLTDWLDGQLARMLGLVSEFGAFLDPVADKIMVATALVLLTTSPPFPIGPGTMALPVAIMISREISMSALREWAAASSADAHDAVKVNTFGKWKTALQMTSMTVLLFVRKMPPAIIELSRLSDPTTRLSVVWIAFLGLWGAAVLSAASFAVYFRNAWQHFFIPKKTKAN